MMKRSLFLACLLGVATSFSFSQAEDVPNPATSPEVHAGTESLHESFNEISKQGKAKLVFLGDSITRGWASEKGKEIWEEYWAPYGAANFGVGGDRTEHVLWRLAHGNYDGLHPKLTVLMIGTNNTGHSGRPKTQQDGKIYNCSPKQTAEGVKKIVEVLREKQPQMKILLLAVFPRGDSKSHPMRQANEKINGIISQLEDGKNVFYMDINQEFLEADGTLSTDIMPDLLHPNERGYQIWAKAIEARVKELMAD